MKFKPPYKPSEVRKEYAEGTWRYALGRPADQHPGFNKAIKWAKKFNPWWIRSWSDVDAVLDGCYVEEAAGKRVCDFFERVLRHSKAGLSKKELAGRRVTLMDWHKFDWFMPMFSWMRTDGTRRFRKARLWVSKKNAKSFACSGLGLYFLTKDGVQSAEVYAAASSLDQAGIIHDEASKMVKKSPELLKRLCCTPHLKKIEYHHTLSKFKALAAEAGTQEGLNWSALLFDEMHVQKDRDYFDTLVFGGAARQEPYLIEISTAGVYDPLSIGWEEFNAARMIYEGSVKDWECFVYIAQAHTAEEKKQWPWVVIPGTDPKKADDYEDPAVHLKANPGIGITIKAEDLVSQATEARNNPAKLNTFLRYRLNVWVNQATRLVNMVKWQKCSVAFTDADMKGRPCIGGLDLSMSRDLTAHAWLFFPRTVDEKYRVIVRYWLPEQNIDELERQSRVPYKQWAADGLLTLTHGPIVDYMRVYDDIMADCKLFDVQCIGYDPYNASDTVQRFILARGADFMVSTRQGMLTLGPATKYICDLIEEGGIEHNGNPITNWHVANAQAIYDKAGNYMITKGDGKKRYKIDGFAAIIIAGARVMLQPKIATSVYERRGILRLTSDGVV